MKKGENNFKFSNRVLYSLITLGILIAVGVGVYAATYTASGAGHPYTEISTCAANQSLRMNAAGTAWECASSSETDIKFKSIEIGAWDMDKIDGKTVNHGLTASKIRSVSVIIVNDGGTRWININYANYEESGDYLPAGYVAYDNTKISLYRFYQYTFDNTNFDNSTMNRGWITVGYVA